MISGWWERYGRPAAEALLRQIRLVKGAEPLAPVTVVVPSNQVGVSTRRLLASGVLGPVCGNGPGLIEVSFLTPFRLAELLGAATLAGSGRRPVSTPVLAAALRGALRDDPGVFAPVAAHPATESALVSAYRELRDLSPGALVALAAQGSRPADVVRLHRQARARLEPQWYDEEDLMLAAIDRLRGGGVPGDVGPLIVYLPERLSGHTTALLRSAATVTPVSVIAGTSGVARADAEVRESMSRLGVSFERGPVEAGVPTTVTADRTRIVTTSDADDEVRGVVRRVLDAVRSGTPLDRIAVLYASPEPYARLVPEHLRAAGIPTNGTAEVTVAGRMAGRVLLHLLDLPMLDFRRQDVLAWLVAAPVRHDGGWAPVAAWERLSREAGVVGGRAHWDDRVSALAARCEARAAAAAAAAVPDAPAWQAASWQADAHLARQLRSFMIALIDRLEHAGAGPQPWPDRAHWARRLLDEVLGGADERESWPPVERKAAERVEIALDRLGALGAIEPSVALDVFTRTLAIELEADLGRTGRFGEGVLVGSVGLAAGLDLDLVVLVGLAEGTFPSVARDDSLLPDAERVAAKGELVLRGGHVDRQHRQFLVALAGADRHILGVPRGDLRRSSERVPSRWVLDVASALAGTWWRPADLLAADVAWVEHVASFDAGLRNLTNPATAQEHRLRSLLAAAPARPDLAAITAGLDAALTSGVTMIDARHSEILTRFDGNLAGLTIPSLIDRGAAATSLEAWARCPHGYFVQHLLRVRPVDQPEDLLEITALDRGSLVHEVLEQFIVEVLRRPPAQRPGPDDAWTDDDLERIAAIVDEVGAAYEARGVTGRPLFWRRERQRLLDELRHVLREDSARRRETRTRPIAAELAFGLSGGTAAVPFPLPDGRVLPLRGKADRVDEANDGTLHVIDYKTGRAAAYKNLSELDPHRQGTQLQLAVYGQAARQFRAAPDAPVQATYWFVSGKGNFVRRGYAVTPEVVKLVGEAMCTIVTGIESGLFPPHPKRPDTSPFVDCRFCDPDDLGTAELWRHWERKLGDVDLAPYLALTDPLGPDDDAEASP